MKTKAIVKSLLLKLTFSITSAWFISTAMVAVTLLLLALFAPRLSERPEVRLNRLVRVEAGRPAEAWMAEFQIQVPSKSRTWLTLGEVSVEMLGVRGDRVGTAPESSTLSGGRTICRTMWLVLPAEVKTCRFTIGFRGLTLQERGMILLTKSRLPRRFPTVANWIIKHLPTTERWVRCRHDVQLIASANRLETNVEMAAPINRTA